MKILPNLNNSSEKKKIIGLLHKIYLSNLKNSRRYTASTKTKSEVRGGGRKPWRQKGTGQARAGSNRSPLWIGGGVVFGPKPRIVIKKINKKERRLAILSALYLKKKHTKIIKNSIFSKFITFKTKNFLNLIKKINISAEDKILIILPIITTNILHSVQNLKNIELILANSLSTSQLLNSTVIILSEEALSIINVTYGKL